MPEQPTSHDALHCESDQDIQVPPHTASGIFRRLGPGLIVAGSIVGSGELIATTKTGAEAGFWLMWLILIGCVIKVFLQVEFGRYAITNGRTCLDGLNIVPGPRIGITLPGPAQRRVGGNWIVLFWFFMFLSSLAQLGGIVGGVGQALQMSVPLTADGRLANEIVDAQKKLQVAQAELELLRRNPEGNSSLSRQDVLETEIAELEPRIAALGPVPANVYDDKIWAAIISVITAVLLVVGRYGMIQSFSTVLVASFTLLTVVNVILLQMNKAWAVRLDDIITGLSFRLTPASEALVASPLITALATFGIIGVGSGELIAYPYWCQEKGYARFTGRNDGSPAWADRARGWMRVLRYDAWCSMFVYTFATLAFYLLGAATLGRIRLNPEKSDMMRTLLVMYEPVFGAAAQHLFLFGAFAVLYSTFFVANAAHARVCGDAISVLGFPTRDEAQRVRRVRWLSGFFPMFCLVVYLIVQAPVQLVMLSGVMQALMLPMLATAGLYFRYTRCDQRLEPGRLWDAFLWLSAVGMLIAGGYLALAKLLPSQFGAS